MGVRHRLIVALAACLALGTGCRRKPPPDTTDAAPIDHLAPDEVVEGQEKAFGLPLPRASHVKARFAKSVHVVSPIEPEKIANFVRARVENGTVTVGSSGTHLENVTVRAEPTRRLTIDIRAAHLTDAAKSELVIQDTTPPPFDPNLSEEERWKKAGLTPSGAVLDPKRLE